MQSYQANTNEPIDDATLQRFEKCDFEGIVLQELWQVTLITVMFRMLAEKYQLP